MVMLRKGVFSLGGPERIADPADDLALEWGRIALARQQAEAQNAIERARLGMDQARMRMDSMNRDRAFAAEQAQAAGFVLDPSTGEHAIDPNTGSLMRTASGEDLAFRIGQAKVRDELDRGRFEREGKEIDFAQEIARRQLDERGLDRAQSLQVARMQDATADKRLQLQDRLARAREDAAWDRQVKRDEDLLRRDERAAGLREDAETRRRDAALAEEADKVAAAAAEAVRRGLVGLEVDDPDVERISLNRGSVATAGKGSPGRGILTSEASLEEALTGSEHVRQAREQLIQSYAAGDNYAVTRPEEIDRIELANGAIIDAYVRGNIERQKSKWTGLNDNTQEWTVYGDALRKVNAEAAESARRRVGAQNRARMEAELGRAATLGGVVGGAAQSPPRTLPGGGVVAVGAGMGLGRTSGGAPTVAPGEAAALEALKAARAGGADLEAARKRRDLEIFLGQMKAAGYPTGVHSPADLQALYLARMGVLDDSVMRPVFGGGRASIRPADDTTAAVLAALAQAPVAPPRRAPLAVAVGPLDPNAGRRRKLK
jgi:hypothetical protein